jgi:hypothetical protein
MLIEQKNDIHEVLARKLQNSKFTYMSHDRENYYLTNHLKIAEKTIMHHMDENDDDLLSEKKLSLNSMKICIVKDICEKLKTIDLRLDNNVDLSKKNFPLIRAGSLWKKSDKGITWEKRYVVVTNKKFYYWYFENDYTENKMPLGYFELKNMYSVNTEQGQLLKGVEIFCIHTSSWYKKEEVKGPRKFYFCADQQEEVYNFIITLNFLRVKAIYDEFTHNFGLINLPLLHEIKGKNAKKIKMKFSKSNPYKLTHKSSNIMNTIRKSVMKIDKEQTSNIPPRRSSTNKINLLDLEADEDLEKLSKTKEILVSTLHLAFPCFMGFLQDIIFNIQNIGINEDSKAIAIPSHLSHFKKCATIVDDNSEGENSQSRMGNILREDLENGDLSNVNGMKDENIGVIELDCQKERNFTLNFKPENDTLQPSTLNEKLINLDITIEETYVEETETKQFNQNSIIFKNK